MVFNSAVFFLFLSIVLLLYWKFFNKNLLVRNLFIIAASLFFYAWWDWRFVGLWMFTSLTDFFVALLIAKHRDKGKALLLVSICTNLVVLGFFKYFNFFVTSFGLLLEHLGFKASLSTLQLVLPVGISFYTFQAMSYTIDVYQKKVEPCRDMAKYLAFISFFPQLVAGPIERAQHMFPQFDTLKKITGEGIKIGLQLILWGLFKKTVIADNLAIYVDEVFNHTLNYSGISCVVASLFFTVQIYCDFSGYTDIARGTARLLGFELMQNFNLPYFASSFTDFWKRWHISLSSWFRDYVYIPLGGNRKGKVREIVNLNLTFILSGLWHGANFTFLIWGALHGAYISLEKILERNLKITLPRILKHLLVFVLVSFAWIFFRAASLRDALLFIKQIFTQTTLATFYENFKLTYTNTGYSIWFLLPLLVFMAIEIISAIGNHTRVFPFKTKSQRLVISYLLVISIVLFGVFNNAPNFIYFQF